MQNSDVGERTLDSFHVIERPKRYDGRQSYSRILIHSIFSILSIVDKKSVLSIPVYSFTSKKLFRLFVMLPHFLVPFAAASTFLGV